jgi:RNA recognition motif-containing protein
MKLFVGLGNLGVPQVGYDDNITSSDLRLLFEQYGVVTECDCITNKNYAFVHMEEDSQATAAVENLDGHWVKGRPIKVEKSESKGPRKPSQKVQKLFIGNIAEGTTNEKTMASEAVRER